MESEARHPDDVHSEPSASATGTTPAGDPSFEHRAWTGHAVLHVDMDAFFASVEQLDHPEWRGRPVVVGGSADARGVIAAASYEARAYGVRSAMPAARAKRLLPPDAVWARGDFRRYDEVSEQVFAILREVTPEVQAASIDEAYMDVTPGAHGRHPVDTARAIMFRVAALGVTCSVGVASGKTVAKIASEVNKPNGLTVVWPGEEEAFLAPLDVAAMPGIGPTTARRLHTLGVRTLGDLAALDEPTSLHVLGSHGPSAVLRARGIDTRPVRTRDPRKSVSHERTFAEDVRDPAIVQDAVRGLAEAVAARLRRHGSVARTVQLKMRFADFTTRTSQVTLDRPTDTAVEITRASLDLLRAGWNPGVGLRLLGVGVSGFDQRPTQLDLLTEPDVRGIKRSTVERTVDEVRERFGDDAVRYGGRGGARDPREKYGPKGLAPSDPTPPDPATSL
jgi:DNA polymerase-4